MKKVHRLTSCIIAAILICLSNPAYTETAAGFSPSNEPDGMNGSISPASFSPYEPMPGGTNYWTLDALGEEIKRAKAVTSIAHQIISNGSLVLQAQKFHTEFQSKDLQKPKMLEG
jgi:hypothetical protein